METRDDMTVFTHTRGAVIPTSVSKGFPSTFTLRRGIAVPRFVYQYSPCGSWRAENYTSYEKATITCVSADAIIRHECTRGCNQVPRYPC